MNRLILISENKISNWQVFRMQFNVYLKNVKRTMKKKTEKSIAKYKKIYKMILSGKTYAETGRKYSLSRERIRQIFIEVGGDPQKKKEMKKKEAVKLHRQKYQNALKIAQQYVLTLDYIPRINVLRKFLLKHGYAMFASKINYELLKIMNLPSTVDIQKNKVREKMIRELKHVFTKTHRPISKSDLLKYGIKRYECYLYYFGTFKKACLLAGIPCPQKGGGMNGHRFH